MIAVTSRQCCTSTVIFFVKLLIDKKHTDSDGIDSDSIQNKLGINSNNFYVFCLSQWLIGAYNWFCFRNYIKTG